VKRLEFVVVTQSTKSGDGRCTVAQRCRLVTRLIRVALRYESIGVLSTKPTIAALRYANTYPVTTKTIRVVQGSKSDIDNIVFIA
jgi:hypothetical protein